MSDWNLRICLVGLVVARPSARRLSNDHCTTGAGYAANSVSRPPRARGCKARKTL
jgi:hypothetical protein